MPWKVFKSGDEYCVHKLNPDESKGEKEGCHPTRAEADDHKQALYASEKGIGLFGSNGTDVVHSQPQLAHFAVVKGANDQLRWIAHYSNNVRDNDNPPEILSAEGHRRFIYLVDKGLVPYPELWVWHQPEWKIGRADWLAIDQKGEYTFALASGYFFEEAKDVGLALAEVGDIAMSHGMYPSSIERDQTDNSILTGFISGEVTVLPRDWAANKLTSYTAGAGQEEKDTMTVKAEKRKHLEQLWPGLGGDILDLIETRNAETAQKAKEMGLETKETEEEVDDDVSNAVDSTKETDAEEETPEEGGETAETKSGESTEGDGGDPEATEQKGVTVEMLASALVAIDERLSSVEKATSEIETVAQSVKAIADRVEAVEEGFDEVKDLDRTPLANQVASILSNSSVVGKDATKVDGRTKLGKDAPEETKSEEGFFFDAWLNGS